MTAQLVAALSAFVDSDGLPSIDFARLIQGLPEGYDLLDKPIVDLADDASTLDATSTSDPANR